MPSDAANAKRKVKRDQQQLDNQQSQPGQPDAVDGKQVKAVNPQMQKTAHHGHGKQSERGHCSELQETPHVRPVNNSGKLATKLLQPIPTRAHNSTAQNGTAYEQTVPGAKAHVDSFGTQYSLQARGLSETQIRRSCEKAWLETFHEMHIVPDEQYEPEFITLFHNTVQQKAARIAESKRRRYARAHRQPQNNSCIHP